MAIEKVRWAASSSPRSQVRGGHQPGGQPPHVPRERLHDRTRRPPGEAHETHVARTSLNQRRQIGLPGADEQVALPMPWHRAVLDGGGALANRDRPDDVPAGLLGVGARPSHRVPLAQLRLERLFQHAAALYEQAEIDRLVRHVHGRIIRIRLAQPPGDLLGRPDVRELGGHRVTQREARRQATPLGPPAARPCRRIGRRGSIAAPSPVPPHLPTHRRGSPAPPAPSG